jgi:DNA-binding transcriptional regulator LsrR (DeoR family)
MEGGNLLMTRLQEQAEERLNHFADLLAQGLELREIAERMGIRTARASQLLMAIRKRLGPQAV